MIKKQPLKLSLDSVKGRTGPTAPICYQIWAGGGSPGLGSEGLVVTGAVSHPGL